jgi:hypothetical protein
MPNEFLIARTCYDHLAGEVAVKVLQAMLQARWLTAAQQEYKATRLGQEKLAILGVDLSGTGRGRRAFARRCVDLTQRRAHLAGGLGAALLDLYVRERWILRTSRSRVVDITPMGREGFRRTFGIAMGNA